MLRNCRHISLLVIVLTLGIGVAGAKAMPKLPPATGGAAATGGGLVAPAVAKPPPAPLAAAVAVAVDPTTGHQYVFWRTPSGVIDEAWFTTSWHGPVSRGWRASSAPSVAVNSAGHQYVAWEGAGGQIDESVYTGSWSRPQNLGAAHHWGRRGQTTGTPAITVSPGSDRPILFWRGPDGTIEESVNNGNWGTPANRGWASASAPSAGVTAAGALFVFWTTADGDIDEAWRYTSWSGPHDLSIGLHWGAKGKASSAPAAVINATNGHQYLFWRGRSGRVQEAWNNDGRWRGPSDQGWRTSSAPGAAVVADGSQVVFWLFGPRLYQAKPQTAAIGRWGLSPGSGAYAEVLQTTASLSQRLTTLSDTQFAPGSTPRIAVVDVDDAVRYQRIDGVGAAMTDTSAWLIHDQLSSQTQANLIKNLFTAAGAHLDFTLTPIGGSDFTVGGRGYTYDDLSPGQTDPTLAAFSVAHDQAYVLPVLRQMMATAPSTRTFAVPWSPPAWMKANDALNDLGHGGTLLASDYQALAAYFVKFIQAYAAQGVPIDAIAPENEPRATSAFPAMYFPESSEDQWLTGDLAPALQAANLHPAIFGNDTSWQSENYADAVVAGPAHTALAGLAWHCYNGVPGAMSDLHARAPGLEQIVTECAPNLTRYAVPEILIGSLRNWASMVTLWNIATDPSGGPVEAPNSGCHGCRGIVTINEKTHALTYNRDYYQLGQVGRFLQDGATRIASPTFVRFRRLPHSDVATAGLDDVALLNPDGSRVVVVYNNSSETRRFAVRWRGRQFGYSLPAGATVSFRWPG